MGRALQKMTREDVALALQMRASGDSYRKIAAHFGVSHVNIKEHIDRTAINSIPTNVLVRQLKPTVKESKHNTLPLHDVTCFDPADLLPTKKRSLPPTHKAKPALKYGDEGYIPPISKAWPSDDWTTWTREQLDTAIKAAKAEGMNLWACYTETGIDKMILMKYFPEAFRPVPRMAPYIPQPGDKTEDLPVEPRAVDPISKNVGAD